MASNTTNKGIFHMWNAYLAGKTIKCGLLTNTYTPSKDHNFVSDLTNEITGGSYVRQTVANVTVVEDDTNDAVYIDCDNPNFGAITGHTNVKYCFYYVEVTNDADSPILAVCDIDNGGTGVTTNGAGFVVQVAADGFLKAVN